jgi:glycosyltransferase involved in cell wall biosynthesis
MTDPLGQSQVLPYLIGRTKEGYNFTLVSCEKKERYDSNKEIIESICKANNIDWQPIHYTKNPPVFSTVFDIYKLNKKVKELHKKKNFSLIHCRSYITALVGLGFKQKHSVKFLFDMRGFWADERIDGNIWSKTKFPYSKIYNFFKKKELEFISQSDAIVSLTHEGKREILSWEKATIKPSKISVIPTCADLAFFDYKTIPENTTQSIKTEFNLTESNYVLTYLGSLGTWYMIEEMIDFYSALKSVKPTAKFVIYTADDFDIVKKQIKRKELNRNDFIFKTLKRSEVPNYLSISDLSVSFIQPLYSKKASSPTKMGEILGMGIPMICNNNVGDVEKIIKENNCGEIITSFNNENYLNAIKSIEKNANINKEQLRKASEAVFSLKIGIQDFNRIYKSILSK